jgi:hypothetical protein
MKDHTDVCKTISTGDWDHSGCLCPCHKPAPLTQTERECDCKSIPLLHEPDGHAKDCPRHIQRSDWREKFDEKFLKDVDDPLGPSLKINHGTLSFIGELEAFIESELSQERENVRREVLAEVDEIFIELHNGRMEPAYLMVCRLLVRLKNADHNIEASKS